MAIKPKDAAQSDPLWQQFVVDGLVEKGLGQIDLITVGGTLSNYSDQIPKDAFKVLKQDLTDEAYKRLNGRWRKYKHNAVHKMTSLTIKQDTLLRLKIVAQKAGLASDNYDLILQYVLEPEDKDIAMAKVVASEEYPVSTLGIIEQSQLQKAKLRFRPATWQYILSLADYAFKAGWLASKSLHAKKRTDEARDASASVFVDKLKGY